MEVIFENFFKSNFSFDLTKWCSPLPVKSSALLLVIYCALNLFLPLCFKSQILKLTVGPWSSFGLLLIFLLLTPGKISESCSFRKLHPGSGLKVAGTVLFTLLIAFICQYWSLEFFKLLGLPVSDKQPLTNILKSAPPLTVALIAVTTVILAPIGEEIIFRRMLYGILLPCGTVKALLLSAFLFSIIHFFPAGICGLFFLALFLQLLYLHTGNIRCPIQAHMFFNALSFFSVLFSS